MDFSSSPGKRGEVTSPRFPGDEEAADLTKHHENTSDGCSLLRNRNISEDQEIAPQETVNEEKSKEAADLTEHQSRYELIRNRNIEEDHQMRSNLEERIEIMKDRCNAALNTYRMSTEQNTQDYRAFLGKHSVAVVEWGRAGLGGLVLYMIAHDVNVETGPGRPSDQDSPDPIQYNYVT